MHSQEPLVGEIKMFAGNFAPRGWMFCDGRLLVISEYSTLYSIIGTTYGGDGRTTMALPDLRGRAAIHAGEGPGLASVKLGQKGGSEVKELKLTNVADTTNNELEKSYTIRSEYSKLVTGDPYLGGNYIIAVQGVYPVRN